MSKFYGYYRWLYRGGRPSALAKVMNKSAACQFSQGWLDRWGGVTLEVPGRKSGKSTSVPLVLADVGGRPYLVSMLGTKANWVLNVKANADRATLVSKSAREVLLHDVPVEARAPIIKRYLDLAPGARPHIRVDRRAPLSEFEAIASDIPVFEVEYVDPTSR